MLTCVLLTVALSSGVQSTSAQGAGDARAQAEQLAREGDRRGALQRLQAIVAANPDDIEARLSIGRLYRELGETDRAIAIYEAIVATNPKHGDALLGLGDALVDRDRLREAADVLTRAEALMPESPAVLAAQGRMHAAAGHAQLANAYFERAIAIDPAAAPIRREYDEVRAVRAHRVEAGYLFEHFDADVPNPQGLFGGVDGRINDALRVSGTVQYQRRFDLNDARVGGGAEWRPMRDLALYGGALFSGGGEVVFPNTDGYGGIAYTSGKATVSFDLRFADFDVATVNVGRAGVRFALPHRSSAWAYYYRFGTNYPVGTGDVVQSFALGASGRVGPKWSLGAEYTRGPDQLDMLTVDRIGAFEADTISGFAEIFATPLASFQARYDYQSRPLDVTLHRVTLRLVHRF